MAPSPTKPSRPQTTRRSTRIASSEWKLRKTKHHQWKWLTEEPDDGGFATVHNSVAAGEAVPEAGSEDSVADDTLRNAVDPRRRAEEVPEHRKTPVAARQGRWHWLLERDGTPVTVDRFEAAPLAAGGLRISDVGWKPANKLVTPPTRRSNRLRNLCREDDGDSSSDLVTPPRRRSSRNIAGNHGENDESDDSSSNSGLMNVYDSSEEDESGSSSNNGHIQSSKEHYYVHDSSEEDDDSDDSLHWKSLRMEDGHRADEHHHHRRANHEAAGGYTADEDSDFSDDAPDRVTIDGVTMDDYEDRYFVLVTALTPRIRTKIVDRICQTEGVRIHDRLQTCCLHQNPTNPVVVEESLCSLLTKQTLVSRVERVCVALEACDWCSSAYALPMLTPPNTTTTPVLLLPSRDPTATATATMRDATPMDPRDDLDAYSQRVRDVFVRTSPGSKMSWQAKQHWEFLKQHAR